MLVKTISGLYIAAPISSVTTSAAGKESVRLNAFYQDQLIEIHLSAQELKRINGMYAKFKRNSKPVGA